jgi:hypothetical protein
MALAASASNAQLIHQYTFDNGTTDSVGNADLQIWEATVSDGKLHTTNWICSAYGDFSAELSTLSSFTFEAWVSGSYLEDVFDYRDDIWSGFVIRSDGTYGAYVWASNWTSNFVPSYVNISDGKLHQVVLAYTQNTTTSDAMDFFVDGVFYGSTICDVKLQPGSVLRIGGDDRASIGEYETFNIYNSALTADEVAANYAAITPEPASLLILGLGGLALRMRKN